MQDSADKKITAPPITVPLITAPPIAVPPVAGPPVQSADVEVQRSVNRHALAIALTCGSLFAIIAATGFSFFGTSQPSTNEPNHDATKIASSELKFDTIAELAPAEPVGDDPSLIASPPVQTTDEQVAETAELESAELESVVANVTDPFEFELEVEPGIVNAQIPVPKLEVQHKHDHEHQHAMLSDQLGQMLKQRMDEFRRGFNESKEEVDRPNKPSVAQEKPQIDWNSGQLTDSGTEFTEKAKSRPRLQTLSESQLKQMLEKLPEISVYRNHAEGKEMLDIAASRRTLSARSNPRPSSARLVKLVRKRPDLSGLPLVMGDDCHLEKDETKSLAKLSSLFGIQRRVRRSSSIFGALSGGNTEQRLMQFISPFVSQTEGNPSDIPGLVQILGGQSVAYREVLVSTLSRTYSDSAVEQIAKRAIFDLSPKVRESAIENLVKDPKVAMPVLLAGMRYPWAPVAQHAAEALVALEDKSAVKPLVELLDMSEPTDVVKEGNEAVSYELVKVNHMKNCILCHAESNSAADTLRARVPYPNQAIPVAYYGATSPGAFVRADTTYLRQDFSTVLPVSDHGEWPKNQRFDFVVRRNGEFKSTIIDQGQIRDRNLAKKISRPGPSLHRQAIVFALKNLTGKDYGDDVFAWREDLSEDEYQDNRSI